MKSCALHIKLSLNLAQAAKVRDLQRCFAAACNALVPIVRESCCWNRVTLHHMAYRSLRDNFPELGSQMVCNAIYSVSRTCRYLFQASDSPFFRQKRGGGQLPIIEFLPTSPVFFDRHTISIKDGMLSMFTLEGRMRFCILLSQEDEDRFKTEKLREVVLVGNSDQFQLNFTFGQMDESTKSDFSQFALILPESSEASDECLSSPALKVSSQFLIRSSE